MCYAQVFNKEQDVFYRDHFKRIQDIVLATLGIIFLSPVLMITAYFVKKRLGSPVIFKQPRPGKDEKIFNLYKFRTMTDTRDENGSLLSDEIRLTDFGKKLRSTSLDELPELFNILKGDMSVVGPRPQLVRDMLFMTDEQRKRHVIRPGLTGLAQINGRNAITWEDKLSWDLKYLEKITFLDDWKIFFETIKKAFAKEGISQEGMGTAEDLGDYLLRIGKLTQKDYKEKMFVAKMIIMQFEDGKI